MRWGWRRCIGAWVRQARRHLSILLVLLALVLHPLPAGATVIEMLELQVPAAAREAWLAAELVTWSPWLEQQEGFLGKEVYWDAARERAVVLVHWRSSDDWHGISDAAMAPTERRFVAQARLELERRGLSPDLAGDPPFPIVSSQEWNLLP